MRFEPDNLVPDPQCFIQFYLILMIILQAKAASVCSFQVKRKGHSEGKWCHWGLTFILLKIYTMFFCTELTWVGSGLSSAKFRSHEFKLKIPQHVNILSWKQVVNLKLCCPPSSSWKDKTERQRQTALCGQKQSEKVWTERSCSSFPE